MATTPLDRRSRGVLLGLALGDALGAPFEGAAAVTADRIAAWVDADDPLRWTDDTHMALTLAEVLVADDGHLDQQRLGDAFARAYAAEPWRGYGAGPPQVFRQASGGGSYVAAAQALFGGAGSLGNGAAMRVAPVALVAPGDRDRVASLAAQQAVVTHAHPEAVAAAVFLAEALAEVLQGALARDELPAALTRIATRLAPGPLRAGVTQVLTTAARRGDVPAARRLRDLVHRNGSGVTARESLPAALAAVLLGEGPVETITTAIGFGGDTDTVAAMAGALAGALDGAAAIAPRLLARLEAHDRIVALTAQLGALGSPHR